MGRQVFIISKLKPLLILLIVCLLSLATLEASLVFFLDNPEYLHGMLKSLVQEYSLTYDRDTVQLDPACAMPDAILSYILKPGHCHQKSREFDVLLSINSKGVRDDEKSLQQPEIIVTGDSQAMGWGVEQEKTFAQLLERAIGKAVLNTAVPSYSTSREIAALSRFDLSRLKTLIIQYCENDYRENLAFYNIGRKFPIIAADQYQYLVNLSEQQKKYFPGKHAYHLLNQIIEYKSPAVATDEFHTKIKGRTANQSYEDIMGANLFVDILNHAPINLDNVQIILIEVNSFAENDSYFVNAVKNIQHGKANRNAVKNMLILDLSPILTSDKYYILDDHMKAAGHEAIFKQLLPLVH